METVFLIIKVVKVKHDHAIGIIHELHKELNLADRDNPNKQVLETNIIQLNTKI